MYSRRDTSDYLDLLEPDYVVPPAEPASTPALIRVADTRQTPFRWVCKILVEYEQRGLFTPVVPVEVTGHWWAGSGTLISRRHVLTAGHVIRTVKGNQRVIPKQILVVPGCVPGATLPASAPFGVWKASKSFVPDSLFDPKQATARMFDFGLLELERKPLTSLGNTKLPGSKEEFGWFGSNPGDSIKQFNDVYGATITQRKVNVAGFPMANGQDRQMHRGFNSIDAVRPSLTPRGPRVPLLRYRIATVAGMSGGPVWLKDLNSPHRQLIAVHNGSGWGVLLRSTLIRFLTASGVPASDLRIS